MILKNKIKKIELNDNQIIFELNNFTNINNEQNNYILIMK